MQEHIAKLPGVMKFFQDNAGVLIEHLREAPTKVDNDDQGGTHRVRIHLQLAVSFHKE